MASTSATDPPHRRSLNRPVSRPWTLQPSSCSTPCFPTTPRTKRITPRSGSRTNPGKGESILQLTTFALWTTEWGSVSHKSPWVSRIGLDTFILATGGLPHITRPPGPRHPPSSVKSHFIRASRKRGDKQWLRFLQWRRMVIQIRRRKTERALAAHRRAHSGD